VASKLSSPAGCAVIPRETRKPILCCRAPSPTPSRKRDGDPGQGCAVDRLRPFDHHRGRNGAGSETEIKENEFTGEIVTLSVQAKNVRIVPETNRSGDNSPSHRVYVGRVEIGAAWAKRSNEGRDYLGLKLDDPSFTAPIFANLFDDEDGEGYSLIWSRPNGRRSD
jgi:uncharacterized protein (DUF736 family)